MTLSAGSRVGRYEIVSLLGAGGMGEVHRAHDPTLGRDVAVKVLPALFANDVERFARFTREAQTLAALNHPNIAAIYGVEDFPGGRALVMELVEGEDLSSILAREPVLVAEALPLARQIAEALEAAHEQGIVHRDLKPANVKVRPDGTVKVLDFGLAKATDPARTSSADAMNSPTISARATQAGVILGTAAYMSPEQARGKTVDKRTDIWAFGCVLYEMLTGRATFQGETLSDVLVSVLEHTPDWTALPPATPPAIRRLLRRCLEKDQRRRLRDIGDARAELEESPGGTETVTPLVARAGRAGDVGFRRLTDFAGLKESPAVSPDGKMVAFVAFVAGRRQIWACLLAGGAPIQVTRDDLDHEEPRWASDSSAIIYYTPAATRGEDGTLWVISALGGWPRRLASATGGGDVSHDGRRIALFQSCGGQLALMTVSHDGSHAVRVALLPAGHTYTLPRWSPDDRLIAFQRVSNFSFSSSLEIVSVIDGERRVVCQSAWMKGFCWLPDGSGLVYSSSHGSTMLYPAVFNLRTVGPDGLNDRHLTFGDQSYAEPDTRHAGKLFASRFKGPSDIWKFPISGAPAENTREATRITRQTGQLRTPSVSPDDTEIVYLSDNGGHSNLWIARTDGSSARQITFERDPSVIIGIPKWSPAGDLIVFVVTRNTQPGLSVIHPDGSGLRQVVASGRAPCWSGDGRWVYYQSLAGEAARLEKTRLDGGQPVVVRDEVDTALPEISADGSTLYHTVIVQTSMFGGGRAADAEIRCARPEDGASEIVACISSERIPGVPPVLSAILSPDGRWLALPLMDGATTNLWALPTQGGPMRQLTDFGDRSIEITRSVSWSPDSRHIYAAVSEIETDVVLFDGLI
jgi:Tol biopolymer transport system component